MKDAARRKVPDGDVLRTPRTLWMGADLREAPLGAEQSRTLKSIHSSGVMLVHEQATEESLAQVSDWLVSAPATQLGEWGDSKARLPVLMERIDRQRGPEGLTDHKIYVFDGVPQLGQVDRGRHASGPSLASYDCGGRMLPHAVFALAISRRNFLARPPTRPDMLASLSSCALDGIASGSICAPAMTRCGSKNTRLIRGEAMSIYRPGVCDRRMSDR